MPQRKPQDRARRAKARGTTMSVKVTDVRDTGARSNHANKKSKGVLRERSFYSRSVSPGSPPGEGVSRNLPQDEHPEGAARNFRKSGRKKTPSLDRGSMPVARVQGRKKRPSQMNVKRKGGPRKRMPLHGG